MPTGEDPIAKLLSVASEPLGDAPQPAAGQLAGSHGASLTDLLRQVNGFYAFESALHVFPSGASETMSIERWNTPGLWRSAYGDLTDGLTFFAEDVFGGQFAISDHGVATFDPETGHREVIAPDLRSWAEVVLDGYRVLTGFPLGHAWQLQHGALLDGQRLLPKILFMLGGAFEIDNLYAGQAIEGMRARGSIAEQVREIPDGATVSYRVVD